MHALATLPLFTQDGDWDHHHWWFVFPLFWISAIALFWFFVGRRRWRRICSTAPVRSSPSATRATS